MFAVHFVLYITGAGFAGQMTFSPQQQCECT